MFVNILEAKKKYKDTEPTAIDLFKLTHCSKTKGLSDDAKKATVGTSPFFCSTLHN